MKTKFQICVFLVILAIFPVTGAFGATDIEGHWAEDLINYSIGQGYVSGYADGTFGPDNPVKRSEFVALANRYMGYAATSEVRFPDVSQSDWFYREVAIASREGYISGYPDGTFRPNDTITRETAAVMASNMLHLSQNSEYASYFTDAGLLTWSRGAVGAAVKAKVISGYDDGTFKPTKVLTRAEAVAILSRVAGKKYDTSLNTSPGYNNYYSTNDKYDASYIPEDRVNYQSTGVSTLTDPDKDGNYRIYGGNYGTNDKTESFYGSVMYDPKYAGTVKNIYVSGDFALTTNISSSSELTLQDVTIRGKLIIYGVSKVTLNNCDINLIEFRADGSSPEIYAGSGTTVRETHVFKSVKLAQETTSGRGFRNVYMDEGCRERDTLTISGDFAYVSVNGKKAKLIIEKGKAETVEIASDSQKCDVDVKSGVVVDFMDVKASCYVHGRGRITLAKISADEAEFDVIPQSVSGTRNPIYTSTASSGGTGSSQDTYGVEITVKDEGGIPQYAVSVRLGEYGDALTGTTGRVNFTGIPNGTYECVVSSQHAKTITRDIVVYNKDISQTIVYDASEKFDVTIMVKMNGGVLENAVVLLGLKRVVTGADGLAKFTGVLPGVYDCSASFEDATGTIIEMISVNVVNMNVSKEIDLP